ncbi:MAG: ThiF family adenylyltransferase [Clostridia bacterium]|nr:ThiF family adenylyltransferase [Clostridia bacterium]
MQSRTQIVIGSENVEKLKNSNIAILGVGGVGGYVAEMIARLGVENITIVDFDKISVSNLNRQIIALNSTIGKYKVEVLKSRILDINPKCNVVEVNSKISSQNVDKILNNNFDYVVDCIDDIPAKIAVAKYCKENKLKIVSSMGTGNRYKMPQFEVSDISKTSYDKLAKKLRKLLKDEGITSLDVIYTKEEIEKTEALGSVVYYPLMCAGTIVSFVVNKIIEK